MKKIYTSIDIGSDTVKVLVCELYKGKMNVLASSTVKSSGIKKGLIVDANEASICIRKAIQEVESMLGIKVHKVLASVPSYGADFSVGTAFIDLRKDENMEGIPNVMGKDVLNVLQNVGYNKIPEDRELVNILPIEFYLDDIDHPVKDPKGKRCKKLGVKTVVVTTPKINVHSVVSLLTAMGLDVKDITFNSIGDYYEFKDDKIDDSISAVINIGSDNTTVSLFIKGILAKTSIINVGGKNIDNDIKYIFKVDLLEARKLKETFAIAHKRYASSNEITELSNINGEMIKINQYEISEVVMERVLEILKFAKKELKVLTNKEISYIIITGGVSEMFGFKAAVDEVFGPGIAPVSLKTLGIRKNQFSSCSGMIKFFDEKVDLRGKPNYSMVSQSDEDDLISNKKKITNFSNRSILGKVFGYFFDN